ncbi:MAG TPA: DNA polymerase III subunit epsilon [Lutibacter sp.]|nr:DNA polymerase III subunit epsilon [Lutibacter sp.]
MYVIIDIETTGGQYNQEGITEIAIYKYDGHDIVDKFVSLVNPQRPIQAFVVNLTGISDKMVKRAPKFEEVAKRIIEITENCILVAHNASFDYRVLRLEFKRLGYDYQRNTLDTVELSKELIPDLPSYSLGKLCKSVGIPIANRHRADGDAFATVSLFELLLQKDVNNKIINQSIKDFSEVYKKEKINSIISKTPTTSGVFYLHQENGRVMYIGKGKNMRSKISQLLAKKSKKIKTIQSKLASVSFDKSGNYTLARLIFNQGIAKHKPRYNSNYYHLSRPVTFENDNMLVICEGRKIGEKSVVLVIEGKLQGFAFTNLEKQITDLSILNKLMLPLDDTLDNRFIVKSSIDLKRIKEIVKL